MLLLLLTDNNASESFLIHEFFSKDMQYYSYSDNKDQGSGSSSMSRLAKIVGGTALGVATMFGGCELDNGYSDIELNGEPGCAYVENHSIKTKGDIESLDTGGLETRTQLSNTDENLWRLQGEIPFKIEFNPDIYSGDIQSLHRDGLLSDSMKDSLTTDTRSGSVTINYSECGSSELFDD